MTSRPSYAAFALAIVLTVDAAAADGFTWTASRTIRIPRTGASQGFRGDRSLQVRRMENSIRLAAAEVVFWQRRLENYEDFRFSDAIRPARDAARIQLLASMIRLEELRAELRVFRRR